jgi:peptidoglycan/xylan/chitin deacetylase (PgdA/CDA1 family)
MIRSLLDLARVRAYLERRVLVAVPCDDRRLALTFDDGPHPDHPPRILDLGGDGGATARLFLRGGWAERHPDLARRIVDEGHEVGNHGWAHLPIPFLGRGALEREIAGGGAAIERTAGRHPRYFRPPLGWISGFSLDQVRRLGYEPVIGDVYARDPARPGTEVIVRHVLARTRPGSIIILHDGGSRGPRSDRTQTVAAAARVVAVLQDEGYRFETLSALAGHPESRA